MKVIVIKRYDPNSYNSVATYAAVAADEMWTKDWIQEEVDGVHGTGARYAQGHTAQWWIDQGYFKLEEVELHGSPE